MSILPQLERDLLHAAERRLAAIDARARRRWLPRRGLRLYVALAGIALLGAGGEALLGSGKPVSPAFVLPASPNLGLGRPLPASLKLLPVREADPDGGPPWGMRVIRTSRGLGCVQAGRVVDGKVGGLGIGYAFGGDGLFHPFAAADAVALDSCALVDANGHYYFVPDGFAVVTADGLPLAGENLFPGQRVHCDLPGQENWGVRCPQRDLREVAMGLLGPDATSIHVSEPGRSFAVAPYGPDGAYLIVLPAPAHANVGPYGLQGRKAPGTPTLTVTFRNGSSCSVPAPGPRQQCAPEGTQRVNRQPLSPARLLSRVSVRYSPKISATAPLAVTAIGGMHSFPRTVTSANAVGPGISVSFKAPVAAPSAASGYDVELEPRPVKGCLLPGTILGQPTQQTLTAGQAVRITVLLASSRDGESSCATVYAGRVFYAASSASASASASGSEARVTDHEGEGPLYEVIASGAARAARGGRPVGMTVARFHVSVP
jgi:hypothetical protein